jgi:hypothetical protein
MRLHRRLALVCLVALLCGCLAAPRAARAHLGPPFPILVDQRAGPYVASVWADPNIGTGIFIVLLAAPPGQRLPARTRVRIGVRPASRRLAEALYEAQPQPVREGARYDTTIAFDRGGTWQVRVLVDGSAGGGVLTAEVEPTPAGSIGPIGFVVYGFPFVGVGLLWLKAALRRRTPRATGAGPGVHA